MVYNPIQGFGYVKLSLWTFLGAPEQVWYMLFMTPPMTGTRFPGPLHSAITVLDTGMKNDALMVITHIEHHLSSTATVPAARSDAGPPVTPRSRCLDAQSTTQVESWNSPSKHHNRLIQESYWTWLPWSDTNALTGLMVSHYPFGIHSMSHLIHSSVWVSIYERQTGTHRCSAIN